MNMFMPATRDWFLSAVGTPTEAQALGWRAISSGRDALISAPTGSGKTLAAFLYFLDSLRREKEAGTLDDALRVLYISPLKALGNDIRENLEKPLRGLGLSDMVRTAVRTGDTDAKARREMIRRPPHILITTPESLYLLLTSVSGRDMLKSVRAVIVDEIHSVLSSKRGTHLFLSLARLDALTGRHVQRVGLSATVRPLETAARHLTGGSDCEIIAPSIKKDIDVLVESPVPDMRILPESSVWPYLADKVTETLNRARTVLVFADGRASCERLAQKVNERAGQILARTHHGCVSKEQRLEAERMLRSGELRVMVATSSMELGIDVGEIDEVIQIGCPGSVSALTQRLGRAGHRPGRVSRMRIYPRTASEGIYCALTARAAMDGRIESVRAPEMSRDVLSQHLISMAACGEWSVEEATATLSRAYAYRNLTQEDVKAVLRMLAGDFEREDDRPARARLLYDRIHEVFRGDAYTRMLALSSGGTIPDRGWYAVTLPDGTRLGELDEEYVFEARLGDKFLLGAFSWKIIEITSDRVVVAAASQEGASSPFWKGDQAMRSYETGVFFGECFRNLDRAARIGENALINELKALLMSPDAAKNAARVILEQIRSTGALATDRVMVFEHFSDEAGEHQLMVHSPFGGRVNRALSMLLTKVAAAATQADARAYDDDDGALVFLLCGAAIPDGLIRQIDPEIARAAVLKLLPASAMFSMAFRYNAARAMLMGARSGRRQPLWVQRLRGAETLAGALKNAEHPIMRETLDECAEYFLDLNALTSVLADIRSGKISVLEVHTQTPSPLSINLRRQVEAELMYENPIPSSAIQMASAAEILLAPARETVEAQPASRKTPETADEVHEYLMTAGDATAEEISCPLSVLESLEKCRRALYISPGLWIAAENEDQYIRALDGEDADAFARVVRRLTRFSIAQDAESVSQRYAIDPARARSTLDALVREGALVPFENAYVHADSYRAAQRRTISQNRSAVRTAPARAYAALLASLLYTPASPDQQLARAVRLLSGEAYPLEAWEGYLLPARVPGYRPAMLDGFLSRGEAVYRLLLPADRALPETGAAQADLSAPGNRAISRSEIYGSVPDNSENRSISGADTSIRSIFDGSKGCTAPNRSVNRSEKSSTVLASDTRGGRKGVRSGMKLAFYPPEDETDEFMCDRPAEGTAESAVYRALTSRGASFARTLAPYADERGIASVLESLFETGLIRADSFVPVRNLSASSAANRKTGVIRRVRSADAGRWEAVRTPRALSAEEKLDRLFERRVIVCRETAQGDWPLLIETLRRMEYAGKVRRGYFIRGMSGAQFVREEDFMRVTAALSAPNADFVAMCAADPMQPWGLYLSHESGREFTRLASTVVILRGGEAVCALEKQGETLRVFENEYLSNALCAFRDAFDAGTVFPNLSRVTVKRCSAECAAALESAGFQREMLDYVLLKNARGGK